MALSAVFTDPSEAGDRAGAGRAYGDLGFAYQSLGDSQQAIEYHNQHISIAKEIGDRAAEGCGYGNLGDAYESLSEFQRAIEYHNQHLSIAKEVGNRACQGKALAKLGFAYSSLNEFQRAIEYNNKYLIIAKEVGDRAGQGQGYGILGNIYLLLGEYQRALEYTNKSLIFAKEDGNRAMEGEAYSVLGATYLNLNEFERAMECHKKHLSIANEVGDRRGKGHAYLNIGNVHNSLGDVPRAMEYYKQSLSNAEEIGDRDGQGHAYCHLGSCYAHLHDFKEAIECYKQHLRISEEIGDRKGEACAHVGLGQSFLHSYSLNEALEHFRCSVKVYDTIRASSISEDELKISFRTQHQFAYTHLWYVLVMLERNDEALYAAERGRAQALLDALKVTYGLTSLSPRSIESEEEVRNISRKTTVLTVFLALHLKTVNIWVLGKEGNPIFRQAEIEIGCEHEDSFTLLLDTVLKNIRDGVGIRCENRSMDKLSDDSTPSSTRDDNQTSEPSQETTDFLQPLYDAVLGPIEDLLDGDELIVVPDGALCLAPWAALRESLRIRMVPSLRSLEVITDSPCEYHSKSGALIVGDPCLEKVTNKWGNPIYEPLKYARMEVEMIGEILESQPLTGKDATKEAVLQRIAPVALVHIAAHGRKETGEIVLTPNPQSGSKPPTEEDYILKMSDIQAVRLRARLVVLSCPHSGQGKVSPEGVVGMARAFLFAGARSVLAALWAIDDEATMMFMKSFYQQLGSGESASVALQRAMKCLRDSHDFSAPRYWAPFVLIGDDVKIELKKNQ
ncbi:tetratricopeptide repeat protein 28-like [Porites lutea]|uniref:tetratricopeptide repeat protein 28-like n=1 Tax=Porites lutea TaxID=51062 RepID=UPI003CC69C7E